MKRDAILLLGWGFIARALYKQLSAQGREVHVLSRHPADADFSLGFWHRGDAQDREILSRLISGCMTIVHLASMTTPGVSSRKPSLELANLVPTLTLLEVLQDFPERHLIYFSSGGTLYGNPDSLPVREAASIRPLSFHGAGKAAQEIFLNVLRNHGTAVTILRPANAYGPGQPLKCGFGLIRTVLEQLHRGDAIEIWGNGEAVRDYIFVDDIASACMMMIDRPRDQETYNVGSGQGYSINELIALAAKVSGRLPRVVQRPGRVGDVSKVVLSVDKIRAQGWEPTTSLEAGLHQTWAWLQEHLM